MVGEVRAGESYRGEIGAGQAVEIMTGAPIPSGADAVVMVEHTRREGPRVVIDQSGEPGQFINPRGCEAPAGSRTGGVSSIPNFQGSPVTRIMVRA